MSDRDDAWYESEEPTRQALVEEMRRISRRTRAHPLRVIALAVVFTTAVMYRVATKKQLVEAEIVLALTEGSLSPAHSGIRAEEVREYVSSVLLPNARLEDIIKHRKLSHVRPGFGMDAAVFDLREQILIEVWKNTFSYNDVIASKQHSARIGITYSDTDPDRAEDVVHDLATVVTETAGSLHQELANQLDRAISSRRESLERQLAAFSTARSQNEQALTAARGVANASLTQALVLEISLLDRQVRHTQGELTTITESREAVTDQFASAGLDMSCEIVEEHRPERSDHRGFVLALLTTVIGFAALLGSALLFGAFDSRVHDVDDIERLGLPVLGHVPGFPGDGVGSLEQRGVIRRRVPSFLRWRSHR